MTNILQRLDQFKTLWSTAMPAEVTMPPNVTFISWLNTYTDAQVEHAIAKSAIAMSRKLQSGTAMAETDAARYVSAVLRPRR